ncbi:matrixin [Bradymonas sediminis]|uniref:Uncharacterized protein n=2 Tax=Bradymonas sediminis TaxID=1548548 RepID=A0A2Z4FHE7_9DELT|nr:hypothetical protein DN745_03095 [Bradymonas sediminis]TDP77510.1 matrixin [Bradymonas sediminis]
MVFAAAAALVLFHTSDAQAFRHTMTCNLEGSEHRCAEDQTPKPLRWSARCVLYHINEDALESVAGGSNDEAALAEVRRAVALSFQAWTDVECSDMTLVDGGLTTQKDSTFRAGDSRNTNLVMWRDKDWDELATAKAFALTSVTYNPRNGIIADADIQVNTELYNYSAGNIPRANHVDLRNTLTHEVGHFIGLDHSDLRNATMYSTAPVGETSKRALHPDDINGLCATYPLRAEEPPQCLRASEFPSEADLGLRRSGCNTGAGEQEPPTGAILIVLGLILLVMRNGRQVLGAAP